MAHIYKVALRFRQANNLNQIGWHVEGPENYAGVEEYSEAVAVAAAALRTAGHLSSTIEFTDIYFNRPDVTGPGVAVIPTGFPMLGTNSANTLGPRIPANFAMRGAVPEYPVRGMIQWPYIYQTWTAFGVISVSAMVNISTFLNTLTLNTISTADGLFTPKLYSRKYNNTNDIATAGFNVDIGVNKRRLK